MLLYTEEFTYTSGRNQSAKQIGLKWFLSVITVEKSLAERETKGDMIDQITFVHINALVSMVRLKQIYVA